GAGDRPEGAGWGGEGDRASHPRNPGGAGRPRPSRPRGRGAGGVPFSRSAERRRPPCRPDLRAAAPGLRLPAAASSLRRCSGWGNAAPMAGEDGPCLWPDRTISYLLALLEGVFPILSKFRNVAKLLGLSRLPASGEQWVTAERVPCSPKGVRGYGQASADGRRRRPGD